MEDLEKNAKESLEKLIQGYKSRIDALTKTENELNDRIGALTKEKGTAEQERDSLQTEKSELLNRTERLQTKTIDVAERLKEVVGDEGFLINKDNEIAFLGEGILKKLGYGRPDVMGKHYSCLIYDVTNQNLFETYLSLASVVHTKEHIIKFKKSNGKSVSYYVGFCDEFKDLGMAVKLTRKAGLFGGRAEDGRILEYTGDDALLKEEIEKDKSVNLLVDLKGVASLEEDLLEAIGLAAQAREDGIRILYPSEDVRDHLLKQGVKDSQLVLGKQAENGEGKG